MYVICLMSVTDSFDDRRPRCSFDLMIVLLHRHNFYGSGLRTCTLLSHQTTYPTSLQLTYDMTTDYKLQQNRRTFTNYKKADWTQFTVDTRVRFRSDHHTTNIHNANIIFTNIILMADKHNIPKGKMHSNCRLLPEDIVCKITVIQLSNS